MEIKNIYLSQYNPSYHIYAQHNGPRITDSGICIDCWVAAYIAHGAGTLEIEGTTIPISEGDVFLIRPNTPYRFVPIQGLRRVDVYNSYFLFDVINCSFKNYKEQFPQLSELTDGQKSYIHAVDTDSREIRDIFVRMIDEQLSNPPCHADMLLGYLIILLTKIFRNTKTSDFKRVYSKNRSVDEAIRYIHNHMYSRISLDSIAKHLNKSPSFVCRLFKKHVGMSTAQFINLLRVEKIKDILKNTDKPVDAIPEMFGCNTEYLKRVFKKDTGMSMREYREKHP